jgi:hypothetical protein
MTEQVQAILPAQEYVDILKQVLEMNEAIVRQNALIVQSVTLPQLIIKGDQQ